MASQRPPSASGSHGAVSPPSLFSAVRVCSSAWGTAACPTQPDALVEVWGDRTRFPGAVAASRAAARLACASPPSTSAYVTRASPAQGLPRPRPGRFLGPQLSAPASPTRPPCLLQLVRPRAQALCSRSPAAAAWLLALHTWGTRSPRGRRQLHCGTGSRTRDAGALVGAQGGTSIPLTFPGFGDIYLAGTMTRFSGAERDALASVRAAQGRAPRAQPHACGRRSQTGSRGHCEAREAASSPGAATVHAGSPGPVHRAAGSVPRPPSPAVCAEGPWGPAGGRGGRALL